MSYFNESVCIDYFKKLLSVDSTTGMNREIEKAVSSLLDELDIPHYQTHKGGVIADLGGEGNDLCITAHLDVIG
ncbi:MAG: hypothetical protein II473_02190, partial [Clostridia bacterium]|nr:hypothetical protein [Clostridia bacterium]